MFNRTILITVSGLTPRTYDRYLKELRDTGKIDREKKYYFNKKKALKIAKEMGFTAQLEKYITKKDGK